MSITGVTRSTYICKDCKRVFMRSPPGACERMYSHCIVQIIGIAHAYSKFTHMHIQSYIFCAVHISILFSLWFFVYVHKSVRFEIELCRLTEEKSYSTASTEMCWLFTKLVVVFQTKLNPLKFVFSYLIFRNIGAKNLFWYVFYYYFKIYI